MEKETGWIRSNSLRDGPLQSVAGRSSKNALSYLASETRASILQGGDRSPDTNTIVNPMSDMQVHTKTLSSAQFTSRRMSRAQEQEEIMARVIATISGQTVFDDEEHVDDTDALNSMRHMTLSMGEDDHGQEIAHSIASVVSNNLVKTDEVLRSGAQRVNFIRSVRAVKDKVRLVSRFRLGQKKDTALIPTEVEDKDEPPASTEEYLAGSWKSIRDIKKIIEVLESQRELSAESKDKLPTYLGQAFNLELERVKQFSNLGQTEMEAAQQSLAKRELEQAKKHVRLARRALDVADRIGGLLATLQQLAVGKVSQSSIDMHLEQLPSWTGQLVRKNDRAMTRLIVSIKLIDKAVLSGKPVSTSALDDSDDEDFQKAMDASGHEAEESAESKEVLPAIVLQGRLKRGLLRSESWKEFLIERPQPAIPAPLQQVANQVQSADIAEPPSSQQGVAASSQPSAVANDVPKHKVAPVRRKVQRDAVAVSRHKVVTWRQSKTVEDADKERVRREAEANRQLMRLVSPELEATALLAARGGPGSLAVLLHKEGIAGHEEIKTMVPLKPVVPRARLVASAQQQEMQQQDLRHFFAALADSHADYTSPRSLRDSRSPKVRHTTSSAQAPNESASAHAAGEGDASALQRQHVHHNHQHQRVDTDADATWRKFYKSTSQGKVAVSRPSYAVLSPTVGEFPEGPAYAIAGRVGNRGKPRKGAARGTDRRTQNGNPNGIGSLTPLDHSSHSPLHGFAVREQQSPTVLRPQSETAMYESERSGYDLVPTWKAVVAPIARRGADRDAGMRALWADAGNMEVFIGAKPSSRPPTRQRLKEIESTVLAGSVGMEHSATGWLSAGGMPPERGLTPKLVPERARVVWSRKGVVVTA